VKGLREAAKAIEKHAAQLCVHAEDCDQPDHIKLVKALCAEHNVHLVTVPSAKTLGEWAGVSLKIFVRNIHPVLHSVVIAYRIDYSG
jgi:ribosomal protein L7Ae-like RNA K-turn-binding protein